jgi:hypothetical protein
MPYIADPQGYGKPILTPEEEAMLASAGGYGPAPAPPPAEAIPPPPDGGLVGAGTAPPPTQTVEYPIAGPSGNVGIPYDYGTSVPVAADPIPAPAYDYAAAEPNVMSPYAVERTRGDTMWELGTQENYTPPPRVTIDPAPRAQGNPNTISGSAMYGRGALDAYNGGYRVTGGTQSMDFNPDPTTPPSPRERRQDRAMAASAPPMPSPSDDRMRSPWEDMVGAGYDLPDSWLNQQPQYYDEEGNLIPAAGVGEAAFIAGPVGGFGGSVVSKGARSTGKRIAPAGATFAERPGVTAIETPPGVATGRAAARNPTVVNAEAPGGRTFPRIAGQPGTPAPGGGWWGPGGRIVYGRESSLAPRSSIAMPAETVPPPPAAPPARQTTGRPVFGQAAGEVVTPPPATGRPSLGQSGVGVGGRSASRGTTPRTTPSTATAPAPAGTGVPTNAPTTAPAPAPVAAGTAGRAARPRLPGGWRGPLLGAGVVGGGGLVASQLAPDANAPVDAVTDPADYPDMTAQVAGWLGRTKAQDWDALRETDTEQWKGIAEPVAVKIDGVRRKVVQARGAPGFIIGYFDENGNVVHVDGDMPPTGFRDLVIANAAEAPLDWPPGAATDADSTPTPESTIYDATADMGGVEPIPTPAETGGSSRSSGGGSSGSRSSGGGSYDRSYDRDYDRSYSRDYGDGGGYEREFTADDFLEQAGGNRRKAEFMARAANKRRRRRGGQDMESGGMWPGFPFNRPPSPIRANILTSLGEAFAQAFPNRRG